MTYVPMTDDERWRIFMFGNGTQVNDSLREIEQAVLDRIEKQGLMIVPKPTEELLDDLDFLLTIRMSGECCNSALPVKTLVRTLKLCKAILEAKEST